MANAVEAQVSDAVAEANLVTIGNGIPVSSTQSLLASTSAQGTVFASAVRLQREMAIAGLAATVKGAAQILALSRRQPARPAPDLASAPVVGAEAPTPTTPEPPPGIWRPGLPVT
jgi:hypothetical protein